MKNYTENLDKYIVKHFYFKVNNSKLNNEKLFNLQVKKVIKRIKQKHKLFNNSFILKKGTIADDYFKNRFTLRISINCDFAELKY